MPDSNCLLTTQTKYGLKEAANKRALKKNFRAFWVARLFKKHFTYK